MKRRNASFGCRKIVEQIPSAFGTDLNEDVVRRILSGHYRPGPRPNGGPSWPVAIGPSTDLIRHNSRIS
jgi:hypothetical protein